VSNDPALTVADLRRMLEGCPDDCVVYVPGWDEFGAAVDPVAVGVQLVGNELALLTACMQRDLFVEEETR
jgi:hypothetical protein